MFSAAAASTSRSTRGRRSLVGGERARHVGQAIGADEQVTVGAAAVGEHRAPLPGRRGGVDEPAPTFDPHPRPLCLVEQHPVERGAQERPGHQVVCVGVCQRPITDLRAVGVVDLDTARGLPRCRDRAVEPHGRERVHAVDGQGEKGADVVGEGRVRLVDG